MTKSKILYKVLPLLFVLSLFTFSLHGQEVERISLLEFLKIVETEQHVRFSYAQDDVENLSLPIPDYKNTTLEELLKYIQQHTSLVINQIDDRYITLTRKSEKPQDFCGRILDEINLLPLEGANILLNNNAYNTFTDSEGYFNIPVNFKDKGFVISYMGYTNLKSNTSSLKTECKNLYLSSSISELQPVMVSNILTRGIFKKVDGSMLLSMENFGLLPGQVENDVLQIAQSLPGVESVDETISNINIRGGSHDENLILWNDIQVYQSGHFFGLISAFNPDITKNVLIHKNGTDARYGNGVSGVIDMRSNNSVPDEFTGGIGMNLINASGHIEIPISSKFGLQIAARKSINNLWESPVYKNYAKRIFQDSKITNVQSNQADIDINTEEDFSFYDLSVNSLWDLSENDKIRTSFLLIDNALDFKEKLPGTSLSKTSELDQSSKLGGISWERSWSNKITTQVLGYATHYLLDAINKDIFTTQEQLQTNEVLETGIKVDIAMQISENINLDAGYQFSELGIANTQDVNLPRFRNYEKYVLRSHIAFTGISYNSKNRKTYLHAGVRANYFERFSQFLVEPRLQLHQKLGNGFAWEALGEFKSQTATQRVDFESDFLGVERRRWILADGEKTPVIQSKQASTGFIYKKKDLFINLTGFYKVVDNINTANQGLQNQFQYTDAIGSYKARGMEFLANQKSGNLSSWLSYLYSKNTYVFKTLNPSNFPSNLEMRHSATLASSYSFQDLKIAFGVSWHSGKPYSIPVNDNEIITQGGISSVNYDMPHAERLPDYFRADLSAEYLWRLSSSIDAKINLALLNVLDTKNTINIRYTVSDDEENRPSLNSIKETSLGITPNLSFQLLF